MIDDLPEREEQQPKNEQQSQSFEQRVLATKERVSSTVIQLRSRLRELIQKHPDLNLEIESKNFEKRAAQLDQLNQEAVPQLTPEPPRDPMEGWGEEAKRKITEEEVIVREYLEKKPQGESRIVQGPNLYEQECIQKQTGRLSFAQKAMRNFAINRLRSEGVQDPHGLMSVLEHNVIFEHGKPIDYLKLDRKKILTVVRGLDPDESKAVQQLELGLKRFQGLNLFPKSTDLYAPSFAEAIKRVSSIPEETIHSAIEDLRPYTFLLDTNWITNGPELQSDTATLIAVLETGGFTQEQKKILDETSFYARLTGEIPINTGISGDHYYGIIDLKEALSPPPNHMAEYHPYVVDYAARTIQTVHQESFYHLERDTYPPISGFTEGLEALRKAGQLPTLEMFVQSGWDCKVVYGCLANIRQDKPEGLHAAMGILEQGVRFINDQERLTWLQQFSQKLGDNAELAMGKIELYEAMYSQRDQVEQLLNIYSALPHRSPINLDYLISKSTETGAFELNLQALGTHITSTHENQAIPYTEKAYADLVYKLLKPLEVNQNIGPYTSLTVSEESIPILSFLANPDQRLNIENHKTEAIVTDALNSGIPDEGQTFATLVSICYSPESLPPQVIWKHINQISSSSSHRLIAQFSEEFIQTLPPEDQQLLNLVRGLSGASTTYILQNREHVMALWNNGHPSPEFFDQLTKNWEFNIDHLLTPEVISTFPEGDRKYWQEFLTWDAALRPYATIHKDNYQDYISDGKPTAKLLNELSSKGYTQGNFNQVYELADIETFPESDKAFWGYYKSSSLEETRRFLLSHRNLFNELVIDNRPTPAFLEQVAETGNEMAIHVLTPNLIDQVDWSSNPDSKPFWEYFKNSNNTQQNFLLKQRGSFNELVVNNKPTPAFLEAAIKSGDAVYVINSDLINRVDWSSDPTNKPFWEFYRNSPVRMHSFLLKERDSFNELVVNNKPTPILLERVTGAYPDDHRPIVTAEFIQDVDWSSNPEDKIFWEYYLDANEGLQRFIFRNKADFNELIANGKPTPALLNRAADSLDAANYIITTDLINQVDWSKNTADKPFWDLYKISSEEMKRFIFAYPEVSRDARQLNFLKSLVGKHGQRADSILKDYQECISAGVATLGDRELILEFTDKFRTVGPTIFSAYKEAKRSGTEDLIVAEFRSISDRIISSGISDEERSKPYFNELLRHVYPNNSGQWSNYERNASCSDRSSDLSGYVIEPRYEIDLLSQSQITLKPGEQLNTGVVDGLKAEVLDVARKAEQLGFDNDQLKAQLNTEVDSYIKGLKDSNAIPGVDWEAVADPEDKMFLILIDSLYGSKSIDPSKVKSMLITYEFANFEDIRDYIAGTTDRVSKSSNQDYALLCELDTFFSDRVKEVNRRLVQSGFNNPAINAAMIGVFNRFSEETNQERQKNRKSRLQVDKLGINDGFVKQIQRSLQERKGRKYTPDQVKRVIHLYELYAGGLQETDSTSENPKTKAIYGQLRSQRERTIQVVKELSSLDLNPAEIHLGEINLGELLSVERGITEGKYNEERFASYTGQRFIDLFSNERSQIEGELDKFQSESGTKREVVNGYISKTKENANARMVGGVCVCGDNPDQSTEHNLWDMPNYFQLVLQDPEDFQCRGLVLLHSFIEGDQKILTASLNPSSTYVYSVDEPALFKGIMGVLEGFATANGFDSIQLSSNRTIRTNRTGGNFERAIDERVRDVNQVFTFEEPKQFSYQPNYQLKEMEAVWHR